MNFESQEQKELELLRGYLPQMLSASELQALVDAAVVELGATSVKQMGAVIKAVSTIVCVCGGGGPRG